MPAASSEVELAEGLRERLVARKVHNGRIGKPGKGSKCFTMLQNPKHLGKLWVKWVKKCQTHTHTYIYIRILLHSIMIFKGKFSIPNPWMNRWWLMRRIISVTAFVSIFQNMFHHISIISIIICDDKMTHVDNLCMIVCHVCVADA